MSQQQARTERTAVIVAGMHRSGTSMTTRIVNLLGADLTGDLIPADIGNERGHWESRAVQELHNRMLAELGSGLYSPVDFPVDWFGGAAARQWIGRMRDLLANEYGSSTLFVLKDPRIALFLPLWSEALRQAAIEPRYLLPFRHPDAVAASLEAREHRLDSGDALPHAQGVAAWLRYVLAAERSTRGQVRAFVAFDRVLTDWRAEFVRIGQQLRIDWPNWQRVDAEIDAFLEGATRVEAAHAPASAMDRICADVFAGLVQAVQEPHAVSPAFDAAARALAAATDLLGPGIVARERLFDDLRRRADVAAQRHDAERADMHGRFADEIGVRDARLADAIVHARRLEETVASLERERGNALDHAEALRQARHVAAESAAQHERDSAAAHGRFAAEIAARDACLAEAAAHARRLEESVQVLAREHAEAAAYASTLEQDRDRAVAHARALQASRDEALQHAQALQQAQDEAARQTQPALPTRNAPPVFFTIAARNYMAYAMTLMQSVAAHHPDAPRYLILADRDGGDAVPVDAPFTTIAADALALPDFEAFAFRYNIMEFNTAIKPYAFSHLRGLHPDSGVVYLDPDILLVEPLVQVEAALAEGALVVLTPHLLDPVDDDHLPGEREILASGTYNCGFVAIGAHALADDLIGWWEDRLEFGALSDVAAGLFTDQKWFDLVPGLFADVHILRDEGYNLAYWNLSQRPVSRRGPRWYAAERPLAFVHFSGVDLDHPERFSRHQDRHAQATIGGLQPLYQEYLGRLAANGHAEHRNKAYAFGRFADGEPICDPVRAVYRLYFDKGRAHPQRDPFSMDRALYDHPSDELPVRDDAPVTRLMHAVWKMRGDLQRAFDIGDVHGREAYARWFAHCAEPQMGIPQRHFDPARRALAVREADARQGRTPEQSPAARGLASRAASSCLDLVNRSYRFGFARRCYALIPAAARDRVRRWLERTAAKPAPMAPAVRTENLPGINLVGYAHGEFGVAEVLRRHAHALQGGGVPFVVRNFDTGVASRQGDRSMQPFLSAQCRYDVNLFCINADQMPVAREQLGDAVFAGRYNIGCWFWELEKFPQQWHGAIGIVDEIWVTSPFVRDAIAACTSKPVHIVPVALDADLPERHSRSDFGLAEGVFLCLFSFDFNSFAMRKNAEGTIAAFRRAFGDGRRDVRLLIKTTNSERCPDAMRRLLDVAAGDDRIEVRDGFLDRRGMWALQACCDCYVSLHRSEGLGLGMAECMLLGKPVVATGYSGNLAFMDADNSCLVDYTLVALEEGEYPAWQGQHWAEPDTAQAAAYLKRLADDPEYARRIGENARASVSQRLSAAASLAAMTARLADIRRSRAGQRSTPFPDAED